MIKLNTDLNPKDISKAYAYVWTHSSSNAMA
nr:MAG TPA: delta endotoxin [Bacteriophage sp.]